MNNSNNDDYLDKEFDFSNAQRNPYAKTLKKQITINVSNRAIDYFKEEAERTGIPYQTLINLFLTWCADNKKKINLSFEADKDSLTESDYVAEESAHYSSK